MDRPRLILLSRIAAVLRAKQFVVFFGIALYLLDIVVPLLTGWLAVRRPLADLAGATNTPLNDVFAHPGVPITIVLAAYLLVSGWLRCGYIRSIVGRFHLGPVNRSQFGTMLLLQTALLCVGAGLVVAADRAGTDSALSLVLLAVFVFASLIALYADYAIVISGAGVVGALRQSWHTVRANLVPSLLVIMLLGTLTGQIAQSLLDSAQGTWSAVLPTILLAVVVAGSLTFVGDVILIMIYVTSIERGAVRPPRAG